MRLPTRSSPALATAIATTLTLLACAPAPERAASDTVPPADTGRPRTGPTSGAADAPPESATVTPLGIGPLRAGMTLAEADAAVGGALAEPAAAAAGSTCTYVAWPGGPPGVRVMLEDGRVARVDVDSGAVATDAGVRVGDDAARVRTAYAGRIAESPHKYVPGALYLTVTPAAPADSAHRLVFEVEDGRVARYRAGSRPAVEYVEGCG